MNSSDRPLRVFLCHSSNDKPTVRELYKKLRAEAWIQPWLDEEELYPGQDWNLEIEKAIESTDVIVVCLSNKSITREGYVQKEIKKSLDFADYKPDGSLFIIPVRLEECKPPSRLSKWQYLDYFPEENKEWAYQKLLKSLQSKLIPSLEDNPAISVFSNEVSGITFTLEEINVAQLLSKGYTMLQISDELDISLFGVNIMKEKMLLKTNQPTIQRFALWWKRNYQPGRNK